MSIRFYLLLLFSALMASGCATGERYRHVPEYAMFDMDKTGSYKQYRQTATALLRDNWNNLKTNDPEFSDRYGTDVELIVQANAPTDQAPVCADAAASANGMLLIHGLYDSPHVMRDLEAYFNHHCFHTRSLLLPGHGTRPASLMDFTYSQWIDAVNAAVRQFKQDIDGDIYIAGFSTGAALGLRHALEHEADIKGLFLFAPALKLPDGVGVARLLSLLGMNWVPTQTLADRDYVKYESMTLDSVLQVHALSEEVSERLQAQAGQLAIPVMIVLAQNDYTIDSATTIDYFERGLFGSRARMLIYRPPAASEVCVDDIQPCAAAKSGNVPDCQCSSFMHRASNGKQYLVADYSHMALTLDWQDPHYGLDGDYQYCTQYFLSAETERICKGEADAIEGVCFGERSAIGSQRYPACEARGLVVRRLTSNPRFESLTRYLDAFLDEL